MKFPITNAIVDYAVEWSNFHIVLSNSNLHKQAKADVLRYFAEKGFRTIIVYFELPIELLKERVEQSRRGKSIFRNASSFKEVLERQVKLNIEEPTEDEANHILVVRKPEDLLHIIHRIKSISALQTAED